MRLASIDIGTDSVHTLVAEVGEDLDLRVLDAEKEMAPLAKSVDKWGNLKKLELGKRLKKRSNGQRRSANGAMLKTFSLSRPALSARPPAALNLSGRRVRISACPSAS